MIYLILALQCEAKPVIDHFQLKQDHSHKKWRLFKNNQIVLIVSGVGKILSSMATTYLLCQRQPRELQNSVVINLGICGTKDSRKFKIGDPVIVNQIIDHGNHRHYFPDLILKHKQLESGLETFDQPVTRDDSPALPLVDMEAAGFYNAARIYFEANRILCLKLVSDALEGKKLSPKSVSLQIRSKMETIEKILIDFEKIQSRQVDQLSLTDQNTLVELVRRLRFSVTQREKLEKTVKCYISYQNRNLESLNPFLKINVKSKYEVNQCFHAIISSLTQP